MKELIITQPIAEYTPCAERLAAATERIEALESMLQSWLRSNDALEWLDDDSPLVVQTQMVLENP